VLMFVQVYLMADGLRKIGNMPGASLTDVKMYQALSGASGGMWMSICLAIALPYFATAMVLDRVQRCTYVATSQGMPLSAYWAGTFLNNYVHFLVLALAVPVCLVVFKAPFFSEAAQMVQLVPAALFAPVPMILFAYAMSGLFNSAEACSKFMPGISLMASAVPFLAVEILTVLSVTMQLGGVTCLLDHSQADEVCNQSIDQGLRMHTWANNIHLIMSFVDPFYCLPGAFVAVGLTRLTDIPLPPGVHMDITLPSFGGSYIAVPLVGAAVLCFLLCLVLALDVQSVASFLQLSFYRLGVRSAAPDDRDAERDLEEGHAGDHKASFVHDSDVVVEAARVANLDPASQAVLYSGLVHTYNQGSQREVRAVRGISLAVAKGECFTLLGPNGAGKTTTLDVLTHAIKQPTQGEVYISGHSVAASRQSRLAALQDLGNCPQLDPLWPTLTGRQHLDFYAKIKGLPLASRKPVVSSLLKALGFSDFDADKATQGYSGGMKRKLSLAIALIGSPPTLMLDEPSAAVDAAAKRHLWRVVKQRQPGQTVILTTHSMEEAEALSDRLAIQVQGRLRCLGTPNHIKSVHGAGYQLEVMVQRPAPGEPQDAEAMRSPDVKKLVADLCPAAKLLEYHEGRYVFQLPLLKAVGAQAGELSLASFLLKMDEAKRAMGLQDYAISRPTLEQVFLRFAKEQEEMAERAAASPACTNER